MGMLDPAPPPFEYEEWRRLPHLERLKPLAQDWALNGFGTPPAVYLLYIVKLIVYAGGGLLLISATTAGLGGLGSIGEWWTEPIFFQKAVVWTMLWEVLGLGAGSLPLTLRFKPMIGGVLYWLRPGTTRLPPWPGEGAADAGDDPDLARRRALRRADRGGALPAFLGRDRHGRDLQFPLPGCGSRLRRSPRPGRRRRPARHPRRPRPARQGPVPRRPGGDLRQPDDRLPLPARQSDRRRAAGLRLHLVGRRRLEAQPPLPLRRHGDDQQHALEPLAQGQEPALHATTPRICCPRRSAGSRPTWAR